MSGPAEAPKLPGDAAGAGSGVAPVDPSMEDILASIRRILNEDGAPATALERREDVLVLDESMMVPDPKPAAAAANAADAPAGAPPAPPGPAQQEAPAPGRAAGPPPGRLVAPEAAAAAVAAVGGLVKRLSSERTATVHRGGPTIEDLVREELRPFLKAWLDANLPALVERVVRAEIERVLGRAVP